jgi:type IV pilus biogenesis protein CpaD/CtpE
MRTILFGMLGLALSGCVTTDREVSAYLDRYYTRADVDAINAEAQCKLLARNLVQIARCEVRR